MAVEVWFVYWCEREQDYDGEWTDWIEHLIPYKMFFRHEDAVDFVVKTVGIACDKKNGSVMHHEVCPGNGFFYYKWEEVDDGITKQHVMQIEGQPRYVEGEIR